MSKWKPSGGMSEEEVERERNRLIAELNEIERRVAIAWTMPEAAARDEAHQLNAEVRKVWQGMIALGRTADSELLANMLRPYDGPLGDNVVLLRRTSTARRDKRRAAMKR
jgi:hypothetical protein